MHEHAEFETSRFFLRCPQSGLYDVEPASDVALFPHICLTLVNSSHSTPVSLILDAFAAGLSWMPQPFITLKFGFKFDFTESPNL